MIPIFDLDDTLYDERTYVVSGFRAVALWGQKRFGQDADDSFAELIRRLDEDGRGRIFDDWLRGRASVREAIKVYRHHDPDIALKPEALALLDHLVGRPLYLVTDGHKIVQAKKIRSLGIEDRFRKCYLTNRYGQPHAKPSLYCFELIRKREKASWPDLVYVGDNPAKDFVSLNHVGAITVRIVTGSHAQVAAARGYEARHRIVSLSELPSLLGMFRS